MLLYYYIEKSASAENS